MNGSEPVERFPFVRPDKVKRVAVICHRNADADAYLSAFALANLLRTISPNCSVDIATPGGVTALTAKLKEKFKHKTVEDSSEEYDLYVAVDVGDTELLKDWKGKMAAGSAERVLVDHHPLRDRSIYDHLVVDERATSAAEVVFGLFVGLGVRVDKGSAEALLRAILFDSSHLAIASEGALRAVVSLMDAGVDLAAARRDLRSEPDQGEVLAKLKGARRLKIFRLGPWLCSTTTVGSFQAHVARSLLNLGSDIAVVGGESGGETRVSLRASQRFYESTKVELGVGVAEEVGKGLGGHGGGHATAASFTCSGGEDEAVRSALDKVAELLGTKPQELN